jgi:probable HAF family extracellular repeat protein
LKIKWRNKMGEEKFSDNLIRGTTLVRLRERISVFLFLILIASVFNPGSSAAAPTISTISPSSAFPGATVTITGQGFTADNTIMFGQTAIQHVPIAKAYGIACTATPGCQSGIFQILVFTVPTSALLGQYNVLVRNSGGSSGTVPFAVVRFLALGSLPGAYSTAPFGVSGDGITAVGASGGGTAAAVAFRWTAASGMTDLGATDYGYAWGTNSDGSVIVGVHGIAQAYRWTSNTGMMGLGFLSGGNQSSAYGANSDGSVLVGWSTTNASGNGQAFRWTSATGMLGLGTLSGYTDSAAIGVNADGSVVVGGATQAFIWKPATGLVPLGLLPGGTISSAYGVSSDGSVVVGRANNSSGVTGGFRWTALTGMVPLGFLPGGTPTNATPFLFGIVHQDEGPGAYGVSADGNVVVGWATDSNGNTVPYRWTPSDGLQSIQNLLTANGVDFTGWTLTKATGVSADGTVVVGIGGDPAGHTNAAWIASLPLPAGMSKAKTHPVVWWAHRP